MTRERDPKYRSLFERHPLFSRLTPPEVDALLSHARVLHHPARKTLFARGDRGDQMIGIVSGRVRISLTGPDGQELILNVIEAGHFFGEIAMLDGRDRTADAMTLDPSELLIIERRDFMPFLARNTEIAVRLLVTLCERMRNATDQIEDIFMLPVPARLAKKLIQIVAAHGATTQAGLRISARISQRELGGMLGLSRESINKHLASWQRAGIVSISGGAITVCDSAALDRLAQDPSSRVVAPRRAAETAGTLAAAAPVRRKSSRSKTAAV